MAERRPTGSTVVLRDGSVATVRRAGPDDEAALTDFFRGLSLGSRVFRFFGAGADVLPLARRATHDPDVYSLVATAGPAERVAGHAMYAPAHDRAVEVAFAIADELQGKGLGTVLLAHLAEAAEARGYRFMEAEVMADNHQMLEVFRESGYPFELRADASAVSLRSPVSLSEAALEHYELRDHVAAVAAVSHVLRPASVALVGASARPGSVGGAILRNLRGAGFTGPVHAVNSRGGEVQGVTAQRSVGEIPEPPELVVIAVPAAAVNGVARECGEIGVRAIVVISAGFGEAGDDGMARQDELVRICRQAGMRLVGPNCLGVLDTAPDTRLNATFARATPPAGPLALMSQSGALGLAAIDQAVGRGLGLACFVSAGNKADLSGNDFIEFWSADERVGVIALYLESFGNPRKFSRIARRVGRAKPIVALKSGRSAAGARAIASHTGKALAGSEMTVDALFTQAGVVRTGGLAELLDVCALLGTQPLPAGDRVAIVTNSGGPGILCADALDAEGMQLAELSAGTRAALAALLPAAASHANPVDMLATASREEYARTIPVVGADAGVDAVIAIYTPTGLDNPDDVLAGIAAGADALGRPVPLGAVALTPNPGSLLEGERAHVPVYGFPEDAARAMAHAARHARWRGRPEGAAPEFADVRPEEGAAVIAGGLAAGGGWLDADRVDRLLRCYGIQPVDSRIAGSPDAAGRAAADLGGAVALKAITGGVLHKTDVGAVRLGLVGERVVRQEAETLAADLGAAGHAPGAFLVQRMAQAGTELLIGVVHDPAFGPVLVCGAGGTAVEVVNDVAARITPLTDADAGEMLRSLKSFPLLEGWRGAPPADVDAVEEAILRLSTLVEFHPEVVEVDLNPVIAGPAGVAIVDARIRIEPAPERAPWPSLRANPPSASLRPAA